MHLDRAGLAQHPDQRALGVAAHDGIVHHDQALAADDVAQRVELEADAQLPDRLGRLDEGAPDVGVFHQALAVRDARAFGVTDRGRGARFGYRNDQIGVDRVLLGQPATDLHPGGVHTAPGNRGVRAG